MYDSTQDNIVFIEHWAKEHIEDPKGKTDEQIKEIACQRQAIEDIKEFIYESRPSSDLTDILFEYIMECKRVSFSTSNGWILNMFERKMGTAELIMESI